MKKRTRMSNQSYAQTILEILRNEGLEENGSIDLKAANFIVKSIDSKQIYFLRIIRVPCSNGQEAREIAISLYNLKLPFGFLIFGSGVAVHLYFLFFRGEQANYFDPEVKENYPEAFGKIADAIIKSKSPGIILKAVDDACDLLEAANSMAFAGQITGIPTFKEQQITELIRAMYRESWWYLVIALPIKPEKLKDTEDYLKDCFSNIQVNDKTTVLEIPDSLKNKQIMDLLRNECTIELSRSLDRIREGEDQGMWKTSCYFGAKGADGFLKLRSKLKSTFIGEDSVPEPIRTTMINNSIGLFSCLISNIEHLLKREDRQYGIFNNTPSYSTALNSRELAILMGTPNEEMPGFEVYTEPRFSVSVPLDKARQSIDLGEVVDRGVSTCNHLYISPHDLVKHGLIVGQTGYGKSRATFNILIQLWQEFKIPWLVIEPVKGEYRKLIATIPEMRVFDLGNESISKAAKFTRFRLNPFDVPLRVPVQNHIDMLLSILNKSFSMYTSLPHVLESCIIRIYEEKGWDLANDVGGIQKTAPTLSDLYYALEHFSLPYAPETARDLQAALLTRVGSLMRGGKGKMLNCPASTPINELLEVPTVLELRNLQDDEQKSLVMAILFGVIYEYIENNRAEIDRLVHLTVLEEAHRILEGVQTDVSSEFSGHPKQKLVANLCNMIAEIRSRGEGILIINQIPTKLSSDAIKNVSLKIIFHTEHEADKEVISKTLSLQEDQKQHLTYLANKEAICLLEGLHGAVKIESPKISIKMPIDEQIISVMEPYYNSHKKIIESKVKPFIGCEKCDKPCEYIMDVGSIRISDERIFRQKLAKGLKEKKFDEVYDLVSDVINRSLFRDEDLTGKKRCFLIQTMNDMDVDRVKMEYRFKSDLEEFQRQMDSRNLNK